MEATAEQKDVLERVVVNAMRVISDESTAPKVSGFLSSGQSVGEGFSNALTFVLKAVIGGMMDKGVDVSPEIVMSENGGASQIGQLLAAMIEAKGLDITMNEIQKGLEISLHNFGKMMEQGALPPEQATPQPAQPQAAPQQPAQPQPAAPQGMLAGAQPGQMPATGV